MLNYEYHQVSTIPPLVCEIRSYCSTVSWFDIRFVSVETNKRYLILGLAFHTALAKHRYKIISMSNKSQTATLETQNRSCYNCKNVELGAWLRICNNIIKITKPLHATSEKGLIDWIVHFKWENNSFWCWKPPVCVLLVLFVERRISFWHFVLDPGVRAHHRGHSFGCSNLVYVFYQFKLPLRQLLTYVHANHRASNMQPGLCDVEKGQRNKQQINNNEI